MKMYLGCQNAPMRFLPCGVSMAVFPPTLESTIARRVVGICTTLTPRMLHKISYKIVIIALHIQGGSHETDQIPYDAAA